MIPTSNNALYSILKISTGSIILKEDVMQLISERKGQINKVPVKSSHCQATGSHFKFHFICLILFNFVFLYVVYFSTITNQYDPTGGS